MSTERKKKKSDIVWNGWTKWRFVAWILDNGLLEGSSVVSRFLSLLFSRVKGDWEGWSPREKLSSTLFPETLDASVPASLSTPIYPIFSLHTPFFMFFWMLILPSYGVCPPATFPRYEVRDQGVLYETTFCDIKFWFILKAVFDKTYWTLTIIIHRTKRFNKKLIERILLIFICINIYTHHINCTFNSLSWKTWWPYSLDYKSDLE